MIAAVALAAWWLSRPGATDRPIGGVYGCRGLPAFVAKQGFSAQAALSTSERQLVGLAVVESAGPGPPRVYQHPSWTQAGTLAPIQLDRAGNVFVVPAPQINVLRNPPAEQNAIYRVDGRSGEMQRFLDLPAAAAPPDVNPFGALGLAFDCDTDTLYVTSVAGSDRAREIGRIFHVDSRAAKVLSRLDNVDAIGVGVFNGVHGKRLYYGLARLPEVWSVALDDRGEFAGTPRLELSLESLGPRGDDKARRIRFDGAEMRIHGIEFNFNLIAPTEKQETVYRFRYDPTTDGWMRAPRDDQPVDLP